MKVSELILELGHLDGKLDIKIYHNGNLSDVLNVGKYSTHDHQYGAITTTEHIEEKKGKQNVKRERKSSKV